MHSARALVSSKAKAVSGRETRSRVISAWGSVTACSSRKRARTSSASRARRPASFLRGQQHSPGGGGNGVVGHAALQRPQGHGNPGLSGSKDHPGCQTQGVAPAQMDHGAGVPSCQTPYGKAPGAPRGGDPAGGETEGEQFAAGAGAANRPEFFPVQVSRYFPSRYRLSRAPAPVMPTSSSTVKMARRGPCTASVSSRIDMARATPAPSSAPKEVPWARRMFPSRTVCTGSGEGQSPAPPPTRSPYPYVPAKWSAGRFHSLERPPCR